MKGILTKAKQADWGLFYEENKSILLCADDIKILNMYGDHSIDWIGQVVDFEIILENDNEVAKLIVKSKQNDVREEVLQCTGCGRLSNEPLGLNENGEKYLACCPDNSYRPIVNDVREDDVEKLAEGFYNKEKITSELKGIIISAQKKGFIDGYNKAKENTYTEEQVREAIDMARRNKEYSFGEGYEFTKEEIIKSIKKNKS